MKRITILILAIIMGLSLVACGGNSNADTPKVGDFTPVPCEVAVHDFSSLHLIMSRISCCISTSQTKRINLFRQMIWQAPHFTKMALKFLISTTMTLG